MSVVIVGGHDRMAGEYKRICKRHKCKAKVFTQMPGSLRSMIGKPDLLVVFTSEVSHKMMQCAVEEAEKVGAHIVHSPTSSKSALEGILSGVCAE